VPYKELVSVSANCGFDGQVELPQSPPLLVFSHDARGRFALPVVEVAGDVDWWDGISSLVDDIERELLWLLDGDRL
jgi:hypothetical protein